MKNFGLPLLFIALVTGFGQLCVTAQAADTFVGTFGTIGGGGTLHTSTPIAAPCIPSAPASCTPLLAPTELSFEVAAFAARSAPGVLGGISMGLSDSRWYDYPHISMRPCPFTGVGTFTCNTTGYVAIQVPGPFCPTGWECPWLLTVYSANLVGTETINVIFDSSCGSNGCYELKGGSFSLMTPQAPIVTIMAPRTLWPRNGELVPVIVSGTITTTPGVKLSGAAFSVTDEYGTVQPKGIIKVGSDGSYLFTTLLQASSLATDTDGRQYTIGVIAQDQLGHTGSTSMVVTVPCDQGH